MKKKSLSFLGGIPDRILIEALEVDLNLRERHTKPDKRHIDKKLRQWARGYRTHDRREISALTGGNCSGSLGDQVKRHNKPNNIYSDDLSVEVDDSEYRRLNGVILSMNVYNQMVLNRHYITRQDFMEKYIASGVLPKRAAEMFLDKLEITKNLYTVDLNDAKDEFYVRGGGL